MSLRALSLRRLEETSAVNDLFSLKLVNNTLHLNKRCGLIAALAGEFLWLALYGRSDRTAG